jgi:hypothetical protein
MSSKSLADSVTQWASIGLYSRSYTAADHDDANIHVITVPGILSLTCSRRSPESSLSTVLVELARASEIKMTGVTYSSSPISLLPRT